MVRTLVWKIVLGLAIKLLLFLLVFIVYDQATSICPEIKAFGSAPCVLSYLIKSIYHLLLARFSCLTTLATKETFVIGQKYIAELRAKHTNTYASHRAKIWVSRMVCEFRFNFALKSEEFLL